MPCLSSLLEITACIASLRPREIKQTIISSQKDKQGINFKEGAKKKNISPPHEWCKFPLFNFKFQACRRRMRDLVDYSGINWDQAVNYHCGHILPNALGKLTFRFWSFKARLVNLW